MIRVEVEPALARIRPRRAGRRLLTQLLAGTVAAMSLECADSRSRPASWTIERRVHITAGEWSRVPVAVPRLVATICDDHERVACLNTPGATQVFADRDDAAILSHAVEGLTRIDTNGRAKFVYGAVGDEKGAYRHVADVRSLLSREIFVWDDRGRRLLLYSGGGELRAARQLPLETDPGSPWRHQDLVASTLTDSGVLGLTVPPGDKIADTTDATLWLVGLTGSPRRVASLRARVTHVKDKDLQPPIPFFLQEPLLAVAGDGTTVYVDPSVTNTIVLRPALGGGAVAVSIDGATRPVLASELDAIVRARWSAVTGHSRDSLSMACNAPSSAQCLTSQFFRRAAAEAPSQHPLATALRVAAGDGHVVWLRHVPDASGDSVVWSAVRTDGTLLMRTALAASDSVAPFDASRALVARHYGDGHIAVSKLRFDPPARESR